MQLRGRLYSRSSRGRFLTGSATALATIGFVSAEARAAQYEFKCASIQPLEHPSIIRSTQMWKQIGIESGGRIHAELFPNSVLGTDAAMLSQLRLGAIQFHSIGGGALQSVVPATDISNVGFAFKDADEALHAIDGPLGEYLRKEIAAKGFYALRHIWDSGVRAMTSSSHPIRTVEDMNGFRVRVTASKITVDFFKTLGASPTPLDVKETYTALQTRIVDGNDSPLATIETLHWFENQRYLSLTNHSWNGLRWIANGDMWRSLPADLQAIVERNNMKYALLERRDTKLFNASVVDKLSRQGLAVNRVDTAPFRARLRTYYETWSGAFGPTLWGLLQSSIGGKLG